MGDWGGGPHFEKRLASSSINLFFNAGAHPALATDIFLSWFLLFVFFVSAMRASRLQPSHGLGACGQISLYPWCCAVGWVRSGDAGKGPEDFGLLFKCGKWASKNREV